MTLLNGEQIQEETARDNQSIDAKIPGNGKIGKMRKIRNLKQGSEEIEEVKILNKKMKMKRICLDPVIMMIGKIKEKNGINNKIKPENSVVIMTTGDKTEKSGTIIMKLVMKMT